MKAWIFIAIALWSFSSFAKSVPKKAHSQQHYEIDLLPYDVFMQLSHQDQRAYLKGIRDILAQLESTNPWVAEMRARSPLFAQLWESLELPAFGQEPPAFPDSSSGRPHHGRRSSSDTSNPNTDPINQAVNQNSGSNSGSSVPSGTTNSDYSEALARKPALPAGANPQAETDFTIAQQNAMAYSQELTQMKAQLSDLSKLTSAQRVDVIGKYQQAVAWATQAANISQSFTSPERKQMAHSQLTQLSNTVQNNNDIMETLHAAVGEQRASMIGAMSGQQANVTVTLANYDPSKKINVAEATGGPSLQPSVIQGTDVAQAPTTPKKARKSKKAVNPDSTAPGAGEQSQVTTNASNAVDNNDSGSGANPPVKTARKPKRRSQVTTNSQDTADSSANTNAASAPAAQGLGADQQLVQQVANKTGKKANRVSASTGSATTAPAPGAAASSAAPASGAARAATGGPASNASGTAVPKSVAPETAAPNTVYSGKITPLTTYRCIYAGFPIENEACHGGLQTLPTQLQGLDSKKFVCKPNEAMCNPILFGFNSSCNWKEHPKPTDPCLTKATPYCVSHSHTATQGCIDQTNSDPSFASAIFLAQHNQAAYRKLQDALRSICNNPDKLNLGNESDAQKTASKQDVQSTCKTVSNRTTALNMQFQKFADPNIKGDGRKTTAPNNPQPPPDGDNPRGRH